MEFETEAVSRSRADGAEALVVQIADVAAEQRLEEGAADFKWRET